MKGLTPNSPSNNIGIVTEGLTKKQLKELRKLEKVQSQNIEKKNDSLKWIAISVVSVLFLVLFVGTIIMAKNKSKPIENAEVSFAQPGHARMLTANGTDVSVPKEASSENVVTIVEYADLQCPACQAYHPIVKGVLSSYPEQVKLVFKHFPLIGIHPNAMPAAIAAEAAGKQGKFFEFADVVYAKQGEWSSLPNPDAKFEEYAKALKLDVNKFKNDLSNAEIAKKIEDERNEGIANGVSGTPTFFVNNKRITNPADLESFKKVIAEELQKSSSTDSQPAQVSPTQTVTTAPEQLPLQ